MHQNSGAGEFGHISRRDQPGHSNVAVDKGPHHDEGGASGWKRLFVTLDCQAFSASGMKPATELMVMLTTAI